MLSPPAQVLWDAMMWRCTRAQLQEVAGRIRAARATLPAEDLARLRQMYAIRRDQVGEGRPMDNPPSVTQLFHTSSST